MYDLRKLQLTELEILKEFKRLCEKHNLKYFMIAGTLLGAVRHKGFIPWDDDVDVAMMRNDYERLANICKTELSKNFYYQNSYTEKNYPFSFAKIRIKNTEVYEPCFKNIEIEQGVYIDIFPLDVCPKNKFFAKLHFKLVQFLTWVYFSKVDSEFVCGYTKWYARLLFFIFHCFPIDWIRGIRNKIAIKSSKNRSNLLCTLDGSHGYPAETYQKEWFSENVEMEFEGVKLLAPVGWNELLTNMYGDYMKEPNLEKQKKHFERVVL